jgi:hypothetical protein
LVLLFLLPLLLAGCGKSQGTVNGTVKVKGEPLAGGMVLFVDADGAEREAASIDNDGNYTTKKLPVGKYKIYLKPPGPSAQEVFAGMPRGPGGRSAFGPPPKDASDAPSERTDRPTGPSKKQPVVPKQYLNARDTPLELEVQKGKQEYPIEITDSK